MPYPWADSSPPGYTPQAPPISHVNPVPGGFDPRSHIRKSTFALVQYLKAIAAKTQGTTQGSELLQHFVAEGVAKHVHDELYTLMTGVAGVVAAQSATCAASGDQKHPDQVTAEGSIDWYEPQKDFFYVLDRRSGAELAAVLEDLKVADRYTKRGARPPNRLLFIGGAGVGKSVGAKWLASQLGLPAAFVRIDGIVSALAGGKAKRVRAAFEEAATRPCVLVVDEFEAIAVPRADSNPNTPQWDKEATAALLQLMEALPPQQIVIGCTNVPQAIDPSVLRRMRDHIYFHNPDRDARAAMLGNWWSAAPHESAAKRVLLDLTEDHSGDVLERAAEHANRAAARRSEAEKITTADVEAAMAHVIATTLLNESKA